MTLKHDLAEAREDSRRKSKHLLKAIQEIQRLNKIIKELEANK